MTQTDSAASLAITHRAANALCAAALAAALVGCASGSGSGGGSSMLFRDVTRAYVYTDTERRNSIHPSSTGEVRYCAAGHSGLVESRRREALAAVASQCAGETQYAIVAEGPADVHGRALGNVPLVGECIRGWAVYFRCLGAQPKPSALR